MQRVTVTLDDELLAEIDRMVVARGYQNRSEAVRDLARTGLRQAVEQSSDDRDCVAALVYVYDHRARELPKRLTRLFHAHHDLSLAGLHVHLDHESCLEVSVLKGRATAVADLADHIIAERGVRHGRLVAIPAKLAVERHAHGNTPSRRHLHRQMRAVR